MDKMKLKIKDIIVLYESLIKVSYLITIKQYNPYYMGFYEYNKSYTKVSY